VGWHTFDEKKGGGKKEGPGPSDLISVIGKNGINRIQRQDFNSMKKRSAGRDREQDSKLLDFDTKKGEKGGRERERKGGRRRGMGHFRAASKSGHSC